MRENRLSGSEGGATFIPSSLPLSIIQSLRDNKRAVPVHIFDSTSPFEDEDDDEHEDDKKTPRLPEGLSRDRPQILVVL